MRKPRKESMDREVEAKCKECCKRTLLYKTELKQIQWRDVGRWKDEGAEIERE